MVAALGGGNAALSALLARDQRLGDRLLSCLAVIETGLDGGDGRGVSVDAGMLDEHIPQVVDKDTMLKVKERAETTLVV